MADYRDSGEWVDGWPVTETRELAASSRKHRETVAKTATTPVSPDRPFTSCYHNAFMIPMTTPFALSTATRVIAIALTPKQKS